MIAKKYVKVISSEKIIKTLLTRKLGMQKAINSKN